MIIFGLTLLYLGGVCNFLFLNNQLKRSNKLSKKAIYGWPFLFLLVAAIVVLYYVVSIVFSLIFFMSALWNHGFPYAVKDVRTFWASANLFANNSGTWTSTFKVRIGYDQ